MVSTIGFVGLGAMGWHMAAQLAPHHPLVVFDIDPARAKAFAAEQGGRTATSLKELAAAVEVIITMLPTSLEVAATILGPDGILASCGQDKLFLEMTSGAPEATREIGAAVTHAKCRIIDAPVSGGVSRARTGALAIMAGGEAATIAEAMPILKLMGASVLETGGLGTGHAMKAINNLVSACTLLATIEGVKIAEGAGLDPARVVDILNASTGMSNSSLRKMHQFILSGTFDSGFSLDLMVKDLTTALAIAGPQGPGASLSRRCVQLWNEARVSLGPGQDHTAIAKAV